MLAVYSRGRTNYPILLGAGVGWGGVGWGGGAAYYKFCTIFPQIPTLIHDCGLHSHNYIVYPRTPNCTY